MISKYRDEFNDAFSEEKYDAFLEKLAEGLTPIPFRVAETPLFIPKELKKKLVDAGTEIIHLIKQPHFKSLTDNAVPKQWKVPLENDHPHFLTFDFGICKDENGELVPKLIEMQGFPSLYGFQAHLASLYKQTYNLSHNLTPFFEGFNEFTYIELLRKVIVGNHKPFEVALMDVDVLNQKTLIDFMISQKYLGIKILSLTDIFKEGNDLFYNDGSKKVQLKRIYNRLVFDEVTNQTNLFNIGFDPREALNIEWITHPNWFYRISKYTMPFLKSEFVPATRFLNSLEHMPSDLENYVLKPLFSFAGTGVIIDVTSADIEAIKDPQNWILQRKVIYEPVIKGPDGSIKAEIRLMYLWADNEEPKLCINLVRLSRGKMIGVRYNKNFDWVGGTIGLMEK